ncbi:MAG: hypothetical protein WBB62_12195 [Rhodococcus sp. (in: high G+C Gram-positive bacteria)]|uniref:hypothetical protein n=1 Tax=Rhodococcoides yunnanense TaxID=278209 RepID=UPI0022B0CC98|nr:hypothetical protein [Rhodococcus yunnanensis]MCZ4278972.1 hypothetical protein [Rhodococcus yunnanensis]
MASDELTGTERLILLVLMAQAEETSNTRLKELGPELKKDHRTRLNNLRLIETDYSRKPMVHSLTDKGWAACARELKSGPPPRATPQAKGTYTILAGLQRFLDRRDLRPSDVFRIDEPAPDSTEILTPAATVAAPVGTSIETLVRTAYADLAPRKGAWVTIRDIRSALPDVPKPKLDRALGEMYRIDDVSLIAEENQKALEDSVRSSAITIAGQPVHLIAIEG